MENKENTARDQVIQSLIEFVIRASQKNATPSEVQALPEVAKILLSTASLFRQ